LDALEMRVRVGGLAFRMLGQAAPVAEFEAVVMVHQPRVSFASRTDPTWRGEFDSGAVRIHGDAGIARERPRAVFVRRAPWPKRWDAIDAMAFSGFALWHYTTFPALLLRPDVGAESVRPRMMAGERVHGIRYRCPPALPAHSPTQTLWVTGDGAVRRLDYRARMIAPWARAANCCLSETTAHGVSIPDTRRVTPLLPGGVASPAPVLVSIDLVVTGVRDR
jgi:hypothetical protein